MKRRKNVYICDVCGEEGIERISFSFEHNIFYLAPEGWKSFGKRVHMCPTCFEAFKRVREQIREEEEETND